MLRALDLFAGAGGSSCGAQQAGIAIAAAIDMCSVATRTFSANFPAAKVITDRLESVEPRRLKSRIGSIDLILASPECTNHSCAKGSAPRSEASRATAMQVIRFAQVLRPRWVVMENVVHMRPWSRYAELKAQLEALGYHHQEHVLDSSDFGVPQKRRRLFLIADRERRPTAIRIPSQQGQGTAKDILDPPGTWQTRPLLIKTRAKATLDRAKRAWAALGKRSSFLLVYYGTDGGGGWQPLDKPLRTVTTIDRFALVEPGNHGPTIRMLQVPELARAMGLPNDYVLPVGTRRDKIRLLGNGVCPPVMHDLLRQLTAS